MPEETLFPEIQQVGEFPVKVTGAKGSELCDGHGLAIEAWGEAAQARGGSPTAFGYLWRRFGPPWQGGDDYKDLATYAFTTPDPAVFLWMPLAGSSLCHSVGYLISRELEEEHYRPAREWEERFEAWWAERNPKASKNDFWAARMDSAVVRSAFADIGKFPNRRDRPADWRQGNEIAVRINTALLTSLRELLRPTTVRDCAFNILGPVSESALPFGLTWDDFAPRSKFAGYGVPQEAMEKWISEP